MHGRTDTQLGLQTLSQETTVKKAFMQQLTAGFQAAAQQHHTVTDSLITCNTVHLILPW